MTLDVGPAIATVIVSVSMVVAARVASGALGIIGAARAAWWLPRLVPG